MSETLFTAQATAKGGRQGYVKSDNGILDHKLVMPKGKTSSPDGTNPEQLFAAGYAACFDGALNLMASRAKKDIDSTIRAEVSLMKDKADDGFKIGVILNVDIAGIEQSDAEDLVRQAHDFCPYSKATRGNIDVKLNVNAG
jgi:lipoyl-dependent peroxiredoxin